jgi:tetratricopeptide (TPR) repeat protein
VLDLSLPRTRYGGIQCFQAVIDSAPIFIGVTRQNDVRDRFSKVLFYQFGNFKEAEKYYRKALYIEQKTRM